MNNKGILYLAFGEEYINLAKQTIAYSRKFTNLDMAIITNRPVDESWLVSNNVNNILLDRDDNDNRDIKTSLINYTPFHTTMFIDVDAVIVKNGVESLYSGVSDGTIIMNKYHTWKVGEKYFNIYRDTIKKFKIKLPVDIYNGAFIVFNKSKETKDFFNKWNNNWSLMGKGRDMPLLCCAVKQTGIKVLNTTGFSPKGDEDKIILHPCVRGSGESVLSKFGINEHKQNKPFDKNNPKDWCKVYYG